MEKKNSLKKKPSHFAVSRFPNKKLGDPQKNGSKLYLGWFIDISIGWNRPAL